MVRWFIDRSPQRFLPSIGRRGRRRDATFVDGQDREVSGCTAAIQKRQPGQVDVAARGASQDGHAFVDQPLKKGAAPVVKQPCTQAGRPQAVVPDARATYVRLSHALAADPADRLAVIGIAGVREGRLVTHLLGSILEVAGVRLRKVGRAGWSEGLSTWPIAESFPDLEGLAATPGEIVRREWGGTLVEVSQTPLEATSIAEGIEFAAVVVTKVRETSEEDADAVNARRRAYARLVRRVRTGGVVVVDEGDRDSEILGAVNLGAERVSIGINRPADVRAEIEWTVPDRSRFLLTAAGVEKTVTLRLGGMEAIRAALAATAVARSRGIDMTAIVEGLEAVDAVPGRFERVEKGQPFEVRVDAAASPEALALSEARDGQLGKVLCVIGAEGHRNSDQREWIAAEAERGADVGFTFDNPRGEDPGGIL